MFSGYKLAWGQALERVMGKTDIEKSPVDFFPAERPDSGCPGRCSSVTVI